MPCYTISVAQTAKKRVERKQKSLDWLQELYFTEGAENAYQAFLGLLPDSAFRPYDVQRTGQGQPAKRTDVDTDDGITYESFNPPAYSEAPYALLRVRFEHKPKRDFIYHGGEEILIPVAGEVYYHFFSNAGAPRAKRQILKPPLKPGDIIRVNPQVPHHTWGGRDGAEAWMIIRHLSDTIDQISLNPQLDSQDLHPTPRKVEVEDLVQPGRYALIAWGLAEKIRLHRDLAHLRIVDLAGLCGIDSSHLSRLENADTNVSLDTLIRIARVLRIGLAELVAPAPWCYESAVIPHAECKSPWTPHPVLTRPPGAIHFLHPMYLELSVGSTADVCNTYKDVPQGTLSSWIVLEGRVIFEIKSAPSTPTTPEFLEKGSVIHFRQTAVPEKIQALQDSKLLQIVYSSKCNCNVGQGDE